LEKFSNIKFIIVGSSKERIIYDKIIKGLSADLFIDLMGKTLTLTSAYMKKSTLFIGNDSGLMHLSVASQLTTIGLFGPTNDNIYGHRSSAWN
jgi:ADP-heptose:LPS heptosyltransferase